MVALAVYGVGVFPEIANSTSRPQPNPNVALKRSDPQRPCQFVAENYADRPRPPPGKATLP
jgi:hypothetical protein